jgi:hypothetical protein
MHVLSMTYGSRRNVEPMMGPGVQLWTLIAEVRI